VAGFGARTMDTNVLSRSIQNLQALDVGAQGDRAQIMSLIVLFNCIVGLAFLLATFFQSYPAAMGTCVGFFARRARARPRKLTGTNPQGFHATTTAMAHLGFCVALNQWLKKPDPSKIDILGGVAIALDLMLLQTTILWSSLAGGVVGGTGGAAASPCFVTGSGGDRAVSAFAGILLTSQLGTQALAYLWRGDWQGASSMGGYGPIESSEPFQGGGRSARVAQAPVPPGSAARDGFYETDAGP